MMFCALRRSPRSGGLGNGAHPALEAVRQQVAQEAKKIMQKQDALNAGNPHWIGLVETCKTMALNEHLKVI